MLNRIILFAVLVAFINISLVAYTANGFIPDFRKDVDTSLPQPKIYTEADMAARFYTPVAPDPVLPPVEINKEIKCLQRNIFHESRNQSIVGQLMVAMVTVERKNSPRYPKSICGVVYQPKQFSWTNNKKTIKENLKSAPEREAWALAGTLATIVLKYVDIDRPILFMTHYHTTAVKPKWSKDLTVLSTIGDHIVYTEKNG